MLHLLSNALHLLATSAPGREQRGLEASRFECHNVLLSPSLISTGFTEPHCHLHDKTLSLVSAVSWGTPSQCATCAHKTFRGLEWVAISVKCTCPCVSPYLAALLMESTKRHERINYVNCKSKVFLFKLEHKETPYMECNNILYDTAP